MKKRQYIIPETITNTFRTEYVCQTAVGSIHGSENINYGGGADPNDPLQKPF